MSRVILEERKCLERLDYYVRNKIGNPVERYYSLGGIKTVRIVTVEDALFLMDRQLAWSRTAPSDNPDATVFLWQEESLRDFPGRALGVKGELEDDFLQFIGVPDGPEGTRVREYMDVDFKYGTVLYDGKDVFYHAVRSLDPTVWGKDGHLFAKIFYRLLKTPVSSLVHSACVGTGGNGILFCAKAMMGKSTLTVASMLKGMEYVSDDYLILRSDGDSLLASPLYNIINLSPKMYRLMFDELDKSRFVCPSAVQDKYTLDISAYTDRMRRNYPVRAAMLPVIDTSATEPVIIPCSASEKGSGITQLIHSTISQVWDKQPSDTIVRLSTMLRPLPFYRIILTPDIFANVECLRRFADSLPA